jgi:protein-S-isoprenylcysteine O-methyltransferase Ste14
METGSCLSSALPPEREGASVEKGILLLLAVVFTAGLTFATLELPYLLDGFLQRTVATPGGDSHLGTVAQLKTELFMAHYHVRALGYTAFFLLLGLIVTGFATRRTDWAALGAVGVMLPVFAQFASVMFFLAGLGMLNALWLPILDISYELQSWGAVIDAPNDFLRGLLGFAGVHSPWTTILFFIGSGILVFLLGVYAWLAARARGDGVARGWVYRISRHPQYLGWILWTYGAYLMIELNRYPKRSWGIGASLPWLISTLVIVAVALVEELNMRKQHGEAYEAYRRNAPFLLPLPVWLTRAIGAPFRMVFGKDRPERVREAVTVVGIYGLLLVGASIAGYGGGLERTLAHFSSTSRKADRIERMVAQAATAPDLHARRYNMLMDVALLGAPTAGPLAELLESPDPALRRMVVDVIGETGLTEAEPALVEALQDQDDGVRHGAALALAAIGSPVARPALVNRLVDSAGVVSTDVFAVLADLGAEEVLNWAPALLEEENGWTRSAAVSALGALGSDSGVPLVGKALSDPEPRVRREAVIALLRIGSPAALPALERALTDSDYEVRIYAAETLKRLAPT